MGFLAQPIYERFIMSRIKPNDQYSAVEPEGILASIVTRQRRHMYARFIHDTGVVREDLVLDVGATGEMTYESSNYLESWYPFKSMVTALGIDDVSFLQNSYPGMSFVQASGLAMPFDDECFDIVHSSAVIEHVGSFENQIKFVKECARVARKAVFLTTPNRWFPIELHTVLPLLHWMPKSFHRSALRALRMEFFAKEENLNLLCNRDLNRISKEIPDFNVRISSVSLCGWPSNLLLTAVRKGTVQ